jgi:hypothetical protein
MDKPTKYIKKYPKSDKGYQCLGPCYDKYVTSVHPITFDVITSKNQYCPVAGHQKFYPSENKFKITYQDECNQDDKNGTLDKNEEIYNNLLPYMEFNIKDFLSMFYEINTFEDGINWISNNTDMWHRGSSPSRKTVLGMESLMGDLFPQNLLEQMSKET